MPMRYWHFLRRFSALIFCAFLLLFLIQTKCLADYQIKGDDVRVDADSFDKNLSLSDNTIQKALETLDDLVATPIVDQYVLTNYDPTSDPMYFGFLKDDGSWFMQKVSSTSFIVLYATGASGYAAAWTGRAGLTYDTYDHVFGDGS